MNADRLTKLANFLETRVSRFQLDMTQWCGEQMPELEDCDSKACAVGWAAVLFSGEGFRLEKNKYENILPVFGNSSGWGAVQEFFDIDGEDANFLFAGDEYDEDDGVSAVVTRIRGFVDAG